jgi:hypothetical protein
MENMLPGNSFPQICVVSVNKYVENFTIKQEYGWATTLSNQTYILSSNYSNIRFSFPYRTTALSAAVRLNARTKSSTRFSTPVLFIN